MSEPQNPEIQLARRAAGGDRDAFADLFEKYFQAVYNYALALCSDPADAEDLTQEAFIRAHRSLPDFGPPWNFRTWIFRMTRNLFLDELRKRRPETSLDEAVRNPSLSFSPESQAVLTDVAGRVRQTLNSLSTRNREALVLREIQNLSYDEMAEVLATTPAYVKTLLARSRSEFREAYGIRLLIEEPTEACRTVGDLLQAYNDGETAPDVERTVREHLKTCKACQKRRRWLLTQSGLLASLIPVLPPPGLAEHILGRVGLPSSPAPAAPRTRRLPHFIRSHPWVLFLCAAAALGAFGGLFFPGFHRPARATLLPTGTRSRLEILPSLTPGPMQSAVAPDTASGTATPPPPGTPAGLLLTIASATATVTPSGLAFTPPVLSGDQFYSGGAGCGPLDLKIQIGLTAPGQVSTVVLFFHLTDQAGSGSTPWNDGVAMEPLGGGQYSYDLISSTIPAFNSYPQAWFVYQFAAAKAGGQVLLRSAVLQNVTLSMCGKK